MLIPAETIITGRLQSAEANHLHLSVGRTPTLIWVIPTPEGSHAIFMSGPYARHAFNTRDGADWSGVTVGPVQVRVDPASANDGEGRGNWQLKASNNLLSFPAVLKPQGFKETVWLPLAEVTAPPDQTTYFSRWSIGCEDPGSAIWTPLITIDADKVVGSLIPETDKEAAAS